MHSNRSHHSILSSMPKLKQTARRVGVGNIETVGVDEFDEIAPALCVPK